MVRFVLGHPGPANKSTRTRNEAMVRGDSAARPHKSTRPKLVACWEVSAREHRRRRGDASKTHTPVDYFELFIQTEIH